MSSPTSHTELSYTLEIEGLWAAKCRVPPIIHEQLGVVNVIVCYDRNLKGVGKQRMMGGHSSVMLDRLMDYHLSYHSIPPG